MKSYLQLTLLTSIFLTSCGGGLSTSQTSNIEENLTTTVVEDEADNITLSVSETNEIALTKGYLLDSAIAGANYQCGDISGITTDTGEFSCKITPIIFSVGELELGILDDFTDDTKVYPQDLLQLERDDFEDAKLIEFVQFLQSLDDDGDITKAITITSDMREKFKNGVDKSELKIVVNKDDAINHLKKTMGVDIPTDETIQDEIDQGKKLAEQERLKQELEEARLLAKQQELDAQNALEKAEQLAQEAEKAETTTDKSQLEEEAKIAKEEADKLAEQARVTQENADKLKLDTANQVESVSKYLEELCDSNVTANIITDNFKLELPTLNNSDELNTSTLGELSYSINGDYTEELVELGAGETKIDIIDANNNIIASKIINIETQEIPSAKSDKSDESGTSSTFTYTVYGTSGLTVIINEREKDVIPASGELLITESELTNGTKNFNILLENDKGRKGEAIVVIYSKSTPAPVDSDGDGTPDSSDKFPNDSSETKDSDNDGVGDNADYEPNNPDQTTNVPAEITGDLTGNITEGDDPISGKLNISDPNTNESEFIEKTVTGLYGNLSLLSDGNWDYEMTSDLAADESYTDSFNVTSIGGDTKTIDITVNGKSNSNSGGGF